MNRTLNTNSLNTISFQKLKRVARLFDNVIEEYYKPHNITVAQSDVMNRIYQEGKLSMNSLCQALEMSKSNLSPICKKLETAGYLMKTRDFYDQRVVYLELTDVGKEIVRTTNKKLEDEGVTIANIFDDKQMRDLCDLLTSIEVVFENAANLK